MTDQDYINQFIDAYDPHNLLISRVRAVSKIANAMIAAGYTDYQIFTAANDARAYWNMEPLTNYQPLERTA